MKTSLISLLICGLCLVGCTHRDHPPVQAKTGESAVPGSEPKLTRAEVLKRFQERAPDAERREFERLRGLKDAESRDQALQTVLFRLTDDELFRLGITAVGQPGRTDWAVAWSLDSDEVIRAVQDAFFKAGVQGGASCDLGHAGWYVPREQFFRARRALLEAPRIRALGIAVVAPKLTL